MDKLLDGFYEFLAGLLKTVALWFWGLLKSVFDGIMTWLWNIVILFMERLNEIFFALLLMIYDGIGWLVVDGLDALGYLIYSMERPPIFDQAEDVICTNFSQISGFMLGINAGGPIMLVLSGFMLRFMIRRIPVIG